MRRCDIDPQIPSKVGHVFSNIGQLRIARQTAALRVSVHGAKRDELWYFDADGKPSRNDDALQFSSIDDERLAE